METIPHLAYEHFAFSYTPWRSAFRYKDRYSTNKKRQCEVLIRHVGERAIVVVAEPEQDEPRGAIWRNFSDIAFQLYRSRFHPTGLTPDALTWFHHSKDEKSGKDRLRLVAFGGSKPFAYPRFLRFKVRRVRFTGPYLDLQLGFWLWLKLLRLPLFHFPALQNAEHRKRERYRLFKRGTVIYWRSLGERLDVKQALLHGASTTRSKPMHVRS